MQNMHKRLQIPLQTFIVWGILLWIALFAPLLSNNKPIICRSESGWSCPIFNRQGHDHEGRCRVVLRPLLPFHPSELDTRISNPAPPWTKSADGRIHYLGTDEYGRDVAAGLIYGTRLSVCIALLSMGIAALLGIVIGIPAGRFQHSNPRMTVLSLAIGGLLVLYGGWVLYWYGGWLKWRTILSLVVGLGIAGYLMYKLLFRLFPKLRSATVILRVDGMMRWTLEWISALPGIFVLLVVLGKILPPGILTVSLLIGLLNFPHKANIIRTEVERLHRQPFVRNAILMGLSPLQLAVRYYLPILFPILGISVLSGMATAIVLESTLSFLGMGLATETMTWGSMLGSTRKYFDAWWLGIFPGLLIYLSVYSLYAWSERLQKRQRMAYH